MSKGNQAGKIAAVLLTLALTVPLFSSMAGARTPTDSTPGPTVDAALIDYSEALYADDLMGDWTTYQEAATFYIAKEDARELNFPGEGLPIVGSYHGQTSGLRGVYDEDDTIFNINPGKLHTYIPKGGHDTHPLFLDIDELNAPTSQQGFDPYGDPQVWGDAFFLWDAPANFDMIIDMDNPPTLSDLRLAANYAGAVEIDIIAISEGSLAAAEAAQDAGTDIDPSLYRTVLRGHTLFDETTVERVASGGVGADVVVPNIYVPGLGFVEGTSDVAATAVFTRTTSASSDENPGTFDTYNFCRNAMGLHANEDAVCVLEGETLGLLIHAEQPCLVSVPVLNCVVEGDTDPYRFVQMEYGSSNRPAALRLTADSAKVNAWTENRAGEVVSEFPTSNQVSKEDREAGFHVLHTNGWGETFITSVSENSNQIGYAGASYQFKSPNAHPSMSGFVRGEVLAEFLGGQQVVDEASPVGADRWIVMSKPTSASNTNHDDLDSNKNNGVQVGKWVRFYPETVDASQFHDFDPLADVYKNVDSSNRMEVVPGTYRLVLEGAKGWKQPIDINIGGHDFEVRLAATEFAAHSVKAGQATKFFFEVENTGGQADEYLISPNSLPGGWGASFSASTLQAGPGNVQKFSMTVTPAPNVVPGDVKDITVNVISKETGEAKTKTVTVLIVALDRPVDGAGNEILPAVDVRSLLNQVETRPNQKEIIPVVVQNLGYVSAKYHVSASGAPPGWGVQVAPSTLTALGQSNEGFTVTLSVPSDAAPGTSFALQLKAIRIGNALDFDVLNLPVSVFTRDNLRVGLFDGSDLTSTHTMKLRDEGVNADTDNTGIPTPDFRKVAQADEDFDQTAIHRVVVTNTGDRPDTYTLKALWDGDFHNGRGFGGGDYGQTGRLNGPNSLDDDRRCDGQDNPDGWRFSWTPSGDPFSLNRQAKFNTNFGYQATSITLAPGETAYLPLEIGWTEGITNNPVDRGDAQSAAGNSADENCPSSFYQQKGDPFQGEEYCDGLGLGVQEFDPTAAPIEDRMKYSNNRPYDQVDEARMQIQVTSDNDPSLFEVLDAGVKMDRTNSNHVLLSRNVYPEASHGVNIDADIDSPLAHSLEKGDIVSYQLRVRNLGNEMDTMRINIPASLQGWEFRIAGIEAASTIFPNLDGGTTGSSVFGYNGFGCGSEPTVPSSTQDDGTAVPGKLQARGSGAGAAACGTVPTTSLNCVMGAGDELVVTVTAKAPAAAVIGDRIRAQVTATSLDDTSKVDSVFIDATVTGAKAFRILQDVSAVTTQAGVPVAIPFTIDNYGLGDDTYSLKLNNAPVDWAVAFSGGSQVFVPGLHAGHGFVSVTPPLNAADGTSQNFKVKITSSGSNPSVKDLDFTVTVDDDLSGVKVTGNPREVVAVKPNVNSPPQATTEVVATVAPASSGDAITFSINRCALPAGWKIGAPGAEASCQEAKDTNGIETRLDLSATVDGTGLATSPLSIIGLDKDIGSSRVSIRVDAVHNTAIGFVDLIVNRATSSSGVGLEDGTPIEQRVDITPGNTQDNEFAHLIVSGGELNVPLNVLNLGLGSDTVALTVDDIPAGWGVSFEETNPALQPLQTRILSATVTAAGGLAPGEVTPIRLRATSQADPAQSALLDLKFITGESVIEMTHETPSALFVAPLEEVTYRIGLVNNGTVPDTFDLDVALSDALANFVSYTLEPTQVTLNPGDGTTAVVTVKLSSAVVAPSRVPMVLEAFSGDASNTQTTAGSLGFSAQMLRYVTSDVDLDGVAEFAVDRDQIRTNGFEQFWEPVTDGIDLQTVDMMSFLSAAAKNRFTTFVPQADGSVKSTSTFLFDLDQDGRADFALDADQDGQPDLWWNQQSNIVDELEVLKDVTKDNVPEWFVDLDADGLLDIWYDTVQGKIGRLIRLDIDGDGHVDYVVDVNSNGIADQNEPVLFSQDGQVRSIQEKIDVTGDGNPDLIFDDDGDGIPDRFVPHGHTRSVKLTLEDIDGDGVAEWTYDGNGDGTRDRFYDPVTGETGRIDTQSEFVSAIKEYWYIGALFGVVLILFVVLLGVTRR